MSAPQPIPISASIEIDATPDAVWLVVSDLARMPEFSPELQKVILLGSTGGVGRRLIGINRRKWLVWPTTSRVVRWEPGKAIAWHTRESGATWVYELAPQGAGTRVTAQRVLPAFTLGSKAMTPLMGGAIGHDHELAAGLQQTLERIKTSLEG
jgi:uncharacterized membrane protein